MLKMNSLTPSYESVPSFYAGKSIFITGGSGYLGKVLIEKIIFSCPLVDKIYVLLREKKSVSAKQRIKNIIDHPLFSRIKAERPDDLKKIVFIEGELTAPNFDMSPQDLQTVIHNVSLVIHAAATVKFNEPLGKAMAVNVEGTRNALDLCKKLKHVDAFVHVSTAYSNCHRTVIEEVLYPAHTTINETYRVVEQGNEKDVVRILGDLPNTYTFTKLLAENLIQSSHGNIPSVIVRPSIVTGAKSEPVQGWVDNWFGPPGVMVPAAMGICRTMIGSYDNNLDIIPVDYVCNAILVAATRAGSNNGVSVYNICSGSLNPISIGDAIKLFVKAACEDRFNLLPLPHLILYTQQVWLNKAIETSMYIVMYISDFVLQISRKKPKFVKTFSFLLSVQKAVSFFTGNSWLMKTPGVLALARSLSPEDYKQFPFNPQDIQWKEYISTYYNGVKKYLIDSKRGKV